MTFYLKYRSKTIDELDLPEVRDKLKSIVKSGNIPHAFLFSGPKGTGKTSAARILAKIINCENLGKDGEPCNECSQCISIMKGNNIDVIEMDAASNRGIDDIRSLKEGIYLTPSAAKKKVYVIDEAHMLTLEAANAFLKTLEEPPDHVYFILATTNPEKLPATVISRLTRVNFTKATAEDIKRQLTRVSKGEKIDIDSKAIEKIAKQADGSFRDAVKILETLSFKTRKIGAEDVGEPVEAQVGDFLAILGAKKAREGLEFVENLVKNGISLGNFVRSVLEELHASLLAKNGIGEDKLAIFDLENILSLVDLINEAMTRNGFPDQMGLEVAIIKYCDNGEVQLEAHRPHEVVKKEKKIKIEVKKDAKPLDGDLWQKLLTSVREKNISMEALLRGTKPLGFDGKNLSLGVYYQFHKDRLEEVKNRKILEDICKGAFSVDEIRVDLELIEREKKEKPKPQETLNTKVEKDIIDAAKEIFG